MISALIASATKEIDQVSTSVEKLGDEASKVSSPTDAFASSLQGVETAASSAVGPIDNFVSRFINAMAQIAGAQIPHGGGAGSGPSFNYSGGYDTNTNTPLEGFASGGIARVTGGSGTDKTLVQFMATRGEVVAVGNPSAANASSGSSGAAVHAITKPITTAVQSSTSQIVSAINNSTISTTSSIDAWGNATNGTGDFVAQVQMVNGTPHYIYAKAGTVTGSPSIGGGRGSGGGGSSGSNSSATNEQAYNRYSGGRVSDYPNNYQNQVGYYGAPTGYGVANGYGPVSDSISGGGDGQGYVSDYYASGASSSGVSDYGSLSSYYDSSASSPGGGYTPATAGSFADGGSFVVGGSGGTDSKRIGMNVTPGERVDVTPPGKNRIGGNRPIVVHNHVYGVQTPQAFVASAGQIQRAVRKALQ